MTHKVAKAAIKKMPRKELLSFLTWLMAWLKTEGITPRDMAMTGPQRKHLLLGPKSDKPKSKRKGNPRALIKAVQANPRMSAEAKRKAIKKLRGMLK